MVRRALSVVDLAEDVVIGVADDVSVEMPRPLGPGGALAGWVTGCSSWWRLVVLVGAGFGDCGAGGFLIDDRAVAGERGGEGADGEIVHGPRVAV
jgi:hypothetical protein